MKTRVSFFLAFFFTGIVFSQENSIQKSGIINYKMKYLSFNGKVFKKINAELHFNENESIFIYNKIGMDRLQQGSSMKMGRKDGEITGVSINIPAIDEKGFLVYRNFDIQKIILRFIPFGAYIVQDNWLPIEWTIMDEYRSILGYKAQKATAQFRGRIYIAWFTREIPVPYGPWKLFGLPGLILEVNDTANVVVFKAYKVCYPCEVKPEILQKPQERKIKTMKEHVYIYDYGKEKATLILNKTFKNGHFIPGSSPTTLEDIKKARNYRFEVIYEWEDFPGDTPNPYEKSLIQQAYESVPDSVKVEFRKHFPEKAPDHYWGEPTQTLETVPQSIPIDSEKE